MPIIREHFHQVDDLTNPVVPASAAALTIDNQSDPPAEVTTIVAPGAAIDGDTATLGEGFPATLYAATATLTDAQIKGLGSASAVTIVSAPGAGKVIVPWFCWVTVDATAGAYTVDEAALINLGYVGGSDASTIVLGGLGVLLGADDEVTFAVLGPRTTTPGAGSVVAPAYDASEAENLPLGMTGFNNGAGDFAGGNAANTMNVKVIYSIEDLA